MNKRWEEREVTAVEKVLLLVVILGLIYILADWIRLSVSFSLISAAVPPPGNRHFDVGRDVNHQGSLPLVGMC
jgi:hypothetical protein